MDTTELKKAAEIANAMTGNVDFEIGLVREEGSTQEEVDAVAGFLQLATPAAVLALIAERDRLREDLEFAKRQPLYSTRRQAARYRWMNTPDNFQAATSAKLWALHGSEKFGEFIESAIGTGVQS
jgi:hypothetical protein